MTGPRKKKPAPKAKKAPARETQGLTLRPEDEKQAQEKYKVGEDLDLGRSVFHVRVTAAAAA